MASFTVSLERLHDDAVCHIGAAQIQLSKAMQQPVYIPLYGFKPLGDLLHSMRDYTDFAFRFDGLMTIFASNYEQMKEKKRKRRPKNQ